jgi:hypothetical protein
MKASQQVSTCQAMLPVPKTKDNNEERQQRTMMKVDDERQRVDDCPATTSPEKPKEGVDKHCLIEIYIMIPV